MMRTPFPLMTILVLSPWLGATTPAGKGKPEAAAGLSQYVNKSSAQWLVESDGLGGTMALTSDQAGGTECSQEQLSAELIPFPAGGTFKVQYTLGADMDKWSGHVLMVKFLKKAPTLDNWETPYRFWLMTDAHGTALRLVPADLKDNPGLDKEIDWYFDLNKPKPGSLTIKSVGAYKGQ